MENITIFSDSCSDIPNIEERKEIKILPLYYYFDNDNVEYGDVTNLTMREFFNKIKMGGIPRTASVNIEKATELFKEELDKGNDIICVCMSSGLSSTYNNALFASNILKEKYPNSKITVIDSLTGSFAEGLIAVSALKMKKDGYNYDEIVDYLEEYKNYYNIEFFVDDLKYLQRGGRISKTVAMAGKLLNIKPLIYVNEYGKAEVTEKVRGTKLMNPMLLDRMIFRIANDLDYIGILHSDDLESAVRLREEIRNLGLTYDCVISEISPTIASHVGPGAYGLTYKMKCKVR